MPIKLFGFNPVQGTTNPFLTSRNVDNNFIKRNSTTAYNTNHPAVSTPDEYKAYIQNRNADFIDYLA